MDQSKIGTYIAVKRKAQGLTQAQLRRSWGFPINRFLNGNGAFAFRM